MSDLLQVLNPATGLEIAIVTSAGLEQIEAAIGAADQAQRAWARTSPEFKANCLFRLADLVTRDAEEIAQLETVNVGKPITAARAEVQLAADALRYYAGAVDKFGGRTIPVAGGVDMTFPEPVGPVGVIVPWNYPFAIATWKIAPSLAAGNVVILKPAELTPLTAMRLLALSEEAGFPAYVIQVLNGPGPTVGAALVEDRRIRKVSFTGSTEVGRQIAVKAGSQLKLATLELGGKSASVVFADADLERAAREAPGSVFGNSGQDCCARSRVLVERPVLDEFLSLFVDASTQFVVGDPTDEATDMGPLISELQRERVGSYIEGDVLYQGAVPEGPGFWYPPTVLGPMSNDRRPAQEEIFGPVVIVVPFDSEDEAVRVANDTRFGLSGSIWTENGAKALRVARELSIGTISINSNSSVRPSTPFGGVKESGHGREMGMEALNWCTETKNVFFDLRV